MSVHLKKSIYLFDIFKVKFKNKIFYFETKIKKVDLIMKTMQTKFNIGIIGLGYVGLPLAVSFSKKFKVIGYDTNPKRIRNLNEGYDATNEINLSLNKKNLEFTQKISNLKNCNIFIITVPTPVNKKNIPNLNYLKKACISVSKIIKKDSIIIFESTVYPGCTEEFCMPIIEKFSGLKYNKDFFLGYSPERINPGKSKMKLENIIKVTSGSDYKTSKAVDKLYKSIIKVGTHLCSSIKVAETAKVIENTQRDINIAFMNELSIISDKLRIDTKEVLAAAETKWNFNKYYPGLVGGHCIGVDPYYLSYKAKLLGLDPYMILAGRKVNNYVSTYVFNKLKKEIFNLKKKLEFSKVLILGATFKENCPDFRNSKVFDIMDKLNKNKIFFRVNDPYFSKNLEIDKKFFSKFVNIEKIREKFDIIIIATAHDKFKKMGIKKIKKYLIDNGKIFDLKSIMSKKHSSFRL